MRLHILSDLHIEFLPFDAPATDADVVILAGDVGVGTRGIDWASSAFGSRPVLYVMGNHEAYGSHLDRVTETLLERASATPNVSFLDNSQVLIGGVRFLGTTLWTDFKLFGSGPAALGRALREAKSGISDFIRNIRYGAGYFTPAQSVELHVAAVAWLEKRLSEPFPGKTVVITHHCPGWGSVADRFRNDWISPAFSSDLSRLMGPPVSLWVHGHTHTSFDYEMRVSSLERLIEDSDAYAPPDHARGTRVVCNPRGYCYRFRNPSEHGVRETYKCENLEFNPGLVVEV